MTALVCMPLASRAADLPNPSGPDGIPALCTRCELSVGIGGTYHFWGRTGGVVFPLTIDLSDNRYELGAFRMATEQMLESVHRPPAHVVAHPYWGSSISRRWQLFGRSRVRFFGGLGFSYKSERDQLNGSQWNFAEQLGVRIHLTGNATLEICARHWSDAGLKLPNRGQDFATVMFIF